MDIKSWALLISLLAFTLSLITFVKTQVWSSLKFDCRMIGFHWDWNNEFCENRFFISASGSQNIYIDKIYLNEGESSLINKNSTPINVKVLLKPGEIEEVIIKNNISLFKHDKTYSFIFTLISANTNQFHCSLQMSTKKQENNNMIVSAKEFGCGRFSLNTINFWRNNKIRKSRRQRK